MSVPIMVTKTPSAIDVLSCPGVFSPMQKKMKLIKVAMVMIMPATPAMRCGSLTGMRVLNARLMPMMHADVAQIAAWLPAPKPT